MHSAHARGNVVMQHGVDGPERAVLGDRLEETVRGNQVRLLDVLKLDGREVTLEWLMPEIEQFVVARKTSLLNPSMLGLETTSRFSMGKPFSPNGPYMCF